MIHFNELDEREMKRRKYIGDVAPGGKKVRGHSDQEDIAIRPAASMDYGFIRALSREVFSLYGNYEDIIPQWLVDTAVMTIVSFEKMQSLGFAMLSMLSGEILAIAVKPEYRGSGIGTELLNSIERIASQLGMERLLLHTATENEVAEMFFRNASFTVIGKEEGYYPRGQAALIMAKEIGVGTGRRAKGKSY
jgi:ribosomal protein S18 acetylase RimI-like enzyme